jgi:hypothetical protein
VLSDLVITFASQIVSNKITGIVFQSGRVKCQKYGMFNKEANQVLPPKYLKSSFFLLSFSGDFLSGFLTW